MSSGSSKSFLSWLTVYRSSKIKNRFSSCHLISNLFIADFFERLFFFLGGGG